VKTASALYYELEGQRTSYVQRARDCALLTIPMLFPPDGESKSNIFETPFQGIGARGVNNISSKLLLALFPPNSSFFRLMIDPYKFKKLGGSDSLKTEIEKALSDVEDAVTKEIETSALRVPFFEALKQLIVGGNSLLYFPDEGGVRVFRLTNYVVKRDPSGNVITIVTKESISPSALPEEAKEVLNSKESYEDGEYKEENHDKYLDLFTCVHLEDGKWKVYQELNKQIIPGSEGTYDKDKCPFIPLRFSRVDGEDYGRGLVEEYLGDLRSLEALTQAVVEGSACASKVLFLVNPNGTTKIRSLSEAKNGQFVSGNVVDVNALQLQKYGDFRVAKEVMVEIQTRLSYAFLLNTSIQRDAERVTAQEIRYMAQELESALGGAYSILSQEFQLPMVNRIMDRMNADKSLPKLPKNNLIRPLIVTGVEALGRGNDLSKLDLFLSGLAQIFGPEALAQYVNVEDYLKRRATALNIDIEGLIKSAEEMQAQKQQAQALQLTRELGPQTIKGISDVAGTAMQQQMEQQQQQ